MENIINNQQLKIMFQVPLSQNVSNKSKKAQDFVQDLFRINWHRKTIDLRSHTVKIRHHG